MAHKILFCLLALVYSALPARAQTPAAPNILFAIADDAGWQHFGAYGCRFVNTPGFDRVAREGVLFRNCFTANPKCSPSRACILTGRAPWQLEEACDHYGIFPAKFAVYPDLLERAGYFVGFTGKGWGPGDWKRGGFTRNPAGPEFSRRKTAPPTTGMNRNDYAANFADFLAQRPKGKPFCFWYGCFEPHRAYAPGSGIEAGKRMADAIVPPYLPDDAVTRSDLLDYGREIDWFDAHLARMLKLLEEAGELENTLVVVTSDNGQPFPRAKGHIYEDGYHLPLAARWPRAIKANRTVEDFIRFDDLAPTFLEAAGLKPLREMTGQSFLNILRSERSGWIEKRRDSVVVGKERHDIGRPGDAGFPVRAIRTRDYLYARNFKPERWPGGNPETGFTETDDSPTKSHVLELRKQGNARWWDLAFGMRPAEELYDLRADPGCVHNLALKPGLAGIKAELWKRLKKNLRDQKDPRVLGKGDVFDAYEYVGPREHAWDTVMKRKD